MDRSEGTNVIGLSVWNLPLLEGKLLFLWLHANQLRAIPFMQRIAHVRRDTFTFAL